MREDHARRCSRIRWFSRRGMKELDVLLERFCARDLQQLGVPELDAMDALLDHDDPTLYGVLVGGARLADPEQERLAARIRRASWCESVR